MAGLTGDLRNRLLDGRQRARAWRAGAA